MGYTFAPVLASKDTYSPDFFFNFQEKKDTGEINIKEQIDWLEQ